MAAAVERFGIGDIALRFTGILGFMVSSVPVGPDFLPMRLVLANFSLLASLLVILLMAAGHAYLFYRAWYQLGSKGTIWFSVTYLVLVVYVASLMHEISILAGAGAAVFFYLTLYYLLGLIYSPLDHRLSGMLHTKEAR